MYLSSWVSCSQPNQALNKRTLQESHWVAPRLMMSIQMEFLSSEQVSSLPSLLSSPISSGNQQRRGVRQGLASDQGDICTFVLAWILALVLTTGTENCHKELHTYDSIPRLCQAGHMLMWLKFKWIATKGRWSRRPPHKFIFVGQTGFSPNVSKVFSTLPTELCYAANETKSWRLGRPSMNEMWSGHFSWIEIKTVICSVNNYNQQWNEIYINVTIEYHCI